MNRRNIVRIVLVLSLVSTAAACAPAPTPVPPTLPPTSTSVPPTPTSAPRPTATVPPSPTAAPTQTPSRPTSTPFPTPRPPIRIGWLPWAGEAEDGYYNSSVFGGIEDYMREPGVVGDYLLSRDPGDYEKNLTTFLQKGYPLIFTIAAPHAALTVKIALANPNTKFGIMDYAFPDCQPGKVIGVDCWSDKAIPNVRGHIFEVDEGAFLAGYLAAGMSHSGKVGTFGGEPMPAVTIYMKGFQAGVEHYNVQHKSTVQVLGWDTKTEKGLFAGTMTDPDKIKSAAQSLIDQGVDVLMPVAGVATGGGLVAAKAAGNMFAIGVDVDHCYFTSSACDILLTSVVKDLGEAVIDTTQSAQEGKFAGGANYVGTLKNGGVGLAPFNKMATQIPDALKKELEQVKQDLINRKIKTGVEPLK